MPPSDSFDHVILTRFSVRIVHGFEFSDEWLAYRWGFFRDGLVASLRRQTVTDFTWLVFFDPHSPGWLRELVDEASTGLFTPIWFDKSWTHEPIQAAVDAVISKPYLITTRIDSDDAVSRYFVEDVQSHFDEQDGLYVNLMHGVQVDRSLQLFHAWFVENAFISYIERRAEGGGLRTVFRCMAHEESSSFDPVLNVIGPPRWMQVIHGSNLANSVRGVRANPGPITPDFDIDLPFTARISPWRFGLEYLVSVWRLLRLWLKHPTFALVYRRALALRLRGTTVVPVHVHAEHPLVKSLRRTWRQVRGRADQAHQRH